MLSIAETRFAWSAAGAALLAGDHVRAVRLYAWLMGAEPGLREQAGFNLALARARYRAMRRRAAPRVAVCGWELAHNAAGRVQTLAEIYDGLAATAMIGTLFPKWGTELWPPIRGTARPCHVLRVTDEARFPAHALALVLEHPFDVVHLSKPRFPNIVFGLLYKLAWGARVLLDVDDEELGIVRAESVLALEGLAGREGLLPRLENITGKDWTRLSVGLAPLFDGVTTSNAALQARYGGPVVPHSRDAGAFRPGPEVRAAGRARFGIPADKTVVLFFGTPRRHKGLLATARALAALRRDDLWFVVVGDFPDPGLRADLQAVPGLRLHLVGSQPFDSIPEVAGMADICVLLQEGSSQLAQYQVPAKLTDALAAGLLVLAEPTAALAAVFAAGAAVPVTPEDLAEALARYLDDPGRAARVRAAGRCFFLEHLTHAAARATLAEAAFGETGPVVPPSAALLEHDGQARLFAALGGWDALRLSRPPAALGAAGPDADPSGSAPGHAGKTGAAGAPAVARLPGVGRITTTGAGRIVVYSVLVGDYEDVKEPAVVDPAARYLLFTDNPSLACRHWEVVAFDTEGLNPRRASRLPKLLAHRYLPDHDVSVYIDASLRIRAGDVGRMVADCLGGRDIALYRHYKRSCVYDEIDFVMNDPDRLVEDRALCERAREKYRAIGYPRGNGLFENGLIVRRNTEAVRVLNETWWREYRDGAERDQFTLMYALWQTGVRPNPISVGAQFRRNPYVTFHKHAYRSYAAPVAAQMRVAWYTGGDASQGWAYGNNAARLAGAMPDFEHSIDDPEAPADVNVYFDILIHQAMGMAFAPDRRHVLRVGGPKPIQAFLDAHPSAPARRALLGRYDAIVALNGELGRQLFRYNKNIHVVPNGLNLAAWACAARKPRPGRFTVGFAGSIETREKREIKGHAFAEEACRRLGLELVTVDKKRRKIAHDRMHEEFFSQIDCLVHPVGPGKEGCSNVIMEALAAGVPVITTRHCGYHAEFLTDGVNVLFAERDADSLARQLQTLAADPARRRQLGRAGRAFAQTHHDLARIAARYRTILSQPAAPAAAHGLAPRIVPIIPFAPQGFRQNLGRAYNAYMALLEEDEWALFLDHDAMFLDRDWLSRAKRIIREHPSFGLLTCRTNRINNPFQKVEGHEDIHDLDHHARLTEALWETHATRVTDVSFGKSISGVILLLSKQAWRESPFSDGFLSVDNKIHRSVRNAGGKVGIAEGLFVYHFYRADGDASHAVRALPPAPPVPAAAEPGPEADPGGEPSPEARGLRIKTFLLPRAADRPAFIDKMMLRLDCDDWAVFVGDDVLFTTKRWYAAFEAAVDGADPMTLFICKNSLTEGVAGQDYLTHRRTGAEIEAAFAGRTRAVTAAELTADDLKVLCLSRALWVRTLRPAALNAAIDGRRTRSLTAAVRRMAVGGAMVRRLEDLYVYARSASAASGRLKIAMITRSFWPKMAGMEMMAHNLATTLHGFGHEVVLFAPRKRPEVVEIDHAYSLERHRLEGREGLMCFTRHHCHGRPFDVIYVQSAYEAASFALELKKRFGLPVVLRTHGEDIQSDAAIGYGFLLDPDMRRVILENLRAADHNVAIGRHIFEDTCRLVDPERVSLIPNGVSTQLFTPERRDALRERFGLAPGTFVLLTVGRNVRKKGFAAAIEALAILRRKGLPCALVHAGREGDAEPLAAVAQRLGVEGSFFQVGAVDYFETPHLYQSADVFVFPSLMETFGNVTVEAMACGLPCVEFDYEVNRDKIVDGVTGFVVPQGDVAAMADRIGRLLADPQMCRRFGQAARARAEAVFSWAVVGRRYEGLLQTLAER
jgi:glycosyltransferase involved in cell wall biosynthesis